MPEGKVALPFQGKNLYHFLQSRGCTREQHLRKAGLEHHFHRYFAVPHSLLPQTFLPLAQIPGNHRQKIISGSSSSWKLTLLEQGVLFSSGTATLCALQSSKQCQSEQGGQGHSSSHQTCSMVPEGACICTLNFTTPRPNVTWSRVLQTTWYVPVISSSPGMATFHPNKYIFWRLQ